MTSLGHPKSFALCLLAAFVQGWIVLKVYASWALVLLYLGILGAIPFMMLNGVHGDSEGAAGIIGGILYVLVSGAVYYGIVVLVLHLWRKRRTRTA
jgi:hypothetical protein